MNRSRWEIRQLISRDLQPAELGLIGARQVARLDKERTEKGQTTTKTQMWLVTSREREQLPPLGFLTARRQEWGIENGLHYVLDVSGDEDRRLKSRTPNCLSALCLLTRLSVALWRHSRKNDQSYYQWREDQKSNCNWLLQLMRTEPAKVKW